jgi:hypothetical protein
MRESELQFGHAMLEGHWETLRPGSNQPGKRLRQKTKAKTKQKKESFFGTHLGGFEPSPQTCTMAYNVQVVLGGLQTHSWLDYEPC